MEARRKVIVITGGSDGVGRAAAQRLAGDGHHVVVVGRSPAKTESVAREIGADFYAADFTRLSDVRVLAARLLERYPAIDVLANNAGGIFTRTREVTEDGHEMTFQVNYLSGFLLTKLLLDRLLASKGTVISTSSVAHKAGRLDVNDLDSARAYNAIKAYGDSKLAQIIFIRELHRRYGQEGLAAASFHPGTVATSFSSAPGSALRLLFLPPFRYLLTTPQKGADTLVFLAEGEAGVDFPSGSYFFKRRAARPSGQANDLGLARALWEQSEAMLA